MAKPVCVIVGVGPGNGTAFARKFAAEGYRVALLARSRDYIEELAAQIEGARAYICDATSEDEVDAIYSQIEKDLGPVEALIYNAGGGAFKTIDEATPSMFEDAWRVNTLGCLLAAKRVIPNMRRAGQGSIVIIGATASWTGNAGFAPFASAKTAQRSLAQSMARHLGPDGIHVAYVIIDAVVDTPRTRQMMPDQPDDFFANPAHIAEAIYFLATQKRSAWTFELDLRPFGERW